MRSVALGGLLQFSTGCGHAPPAPVVTGPTVEVALDDGPSSEKPLTPPSTFEMLVRVDPKMPVYRVRSLRFLLAQPGHIHFALYAVDSYGHPGGLLKAIDRVYGAELVSSGSDGKWVVEAVDDLAAQRAPLFVGISCPEKTSDPRLWATSNASGEVFQRDADPSVPFDQLKIPRTPRLRVVVEPAQ